MQYYISIHAPLAGCDPGLLLLLFFGIKISIHAPLAGCDRPARRNRQSCAHFNPRTPCGVRPSRSCSRPSTTATFQSTHPLRGATALHQREIVIAFPFQSTHPLRGATLGGYRLILPILYFNPRTPCGVRQSTSPCWSTKLTFQSTHPLRGATSVSDAWSASVEAFQSTHPLRGATQHQGRDGLRESYFTPRTPCGVRPKRSGFNPSGREFQSTHPLRGATMIV